MSMVIIDDNIRNEIKRLIKNATEKPTSYETMKKLSKGQPAPGGVNTDFTMYIPEKICVTYTHEEIKEDVMCRHISISVSIKGRVPHPAAIIMIMEEFGFKNIPKSLNPNEWSNLIIWDEKFGDKTQTAINIIEALSGNIYEIMYGRGN